MYINKKVPIHIINLLCEHMLLEVPFTLYHISQKSQTYVNMPLCMTNIYLVLNHTALFLQI